MVYKLKTDAETRAHGQFLMNFKGVRTENIFNKVNISRSSLYPIVKAQAITGRVRIDTKWGYSLAGHGNIASDNIRFSSLFAAEDVSRETKRPWRRRARRNGCFRRLRKYGALVRSGRHCVQYRNYGKVKVNSWSIQ